MSMVEYKLKIIKPVLISSMILGVGFLAFFYSVFHFIAMTKMSNNIDETLYQVIRLKSAVVNTQAAQRGYLLTNNMAFIKNFEAGQEEISQSLKQLDYTTFHSHEIINRLQKVKGLINQNLNSLNAGIQIAMNSGAYAAHLNSSKVGVNTATIISEQLAIVDSTLKQEKMTINKRVSKFITVAIGIVTFLIISVIGTLINGYRRTVNLFEMVVESQQAADDWGHKAYHDILTKLPNRRYFETHFKNSISLASRNNQTLALLFIDLDGFKRINDLYGHDIGDAALQYFAKKLKPMLRGHDFMARLGGDEFAIVLQQNVDSDAVYSLGKRIIASFDQTFELSGNVCKLGASIGVSLFPKHGERMEELIAAADHAMYKAKHNGKNMIVFAT